MKCSKNVRYFDKNEMKRKRAMLNIITFQVYLTNIFIKHSTNKLVFFISIAFHLYSKENE